MNSIYFKKGNAAVDVISFIVVIIALGFIIVLNGLIFTGMNDEIQQNPDMSDLAKEKVAEAHARHYSLWDNLFIMVFSFVWIGLLAAAFYIDSHPFFMIISVVLMIAVFIVGANLSNAYEEMMSDDDLAVEKIKYPKMNFIMSNFLKMFVVIAFSVIMVQFVKKQ